VSHSELDVSLCSIRKKWACGTPYVHAPLAQSWYIAPNCLNKEADCKKHQGQSSKG
jgi:hypothetical protein